MAVSDPCNKHFIELSMSMNRERYVNSDRFGNPSYMDLGPGTITTEIHLHEVVIQVGGEIAIVDLQLDLRGEHGQMMALLRKLSAKSKDGFEFNISIKVPNDYKLIKHNIDKNLRLQNMVIDGDDTSLIGGL